METGGYAAIILAGGHARRLGGAQKPRLTVGGVPLVDRVLAAVADAAERVVVGPPMPLPAGVRQTIEHPPGGGPAAAVAAGLDLVHPETPAVALLAADLPFLTPAAVRRLREALQDPAWDGVVYIDDDGKRQLLCGLWRSDALRRMAATAEAGSSMRQLVGDLSVADVATCAKPPPWYDCDTSEELSLAEEWSYEQAG